MRAHPTAATTPLAIALIVAVMGVSLPARAQTLNADDLEKAFTAPSRGLKALKTQDGTATTSPSPPPAQQTSVKAPARPTTTNASTTAAPQSDEGGSASLVVQFGNGSAELSPAAYQQLDELGKALTSPGLASSRFRIEGHTDTVGNRDYNRALSQQRAAAVVNYLVSKFGLDATRLQAVGLGADQLLVATPDQTPEPRNRRVRVVNLGAASSS